MNGGLTYKDLDVLKLKARNLDAALEFLSGRVDCERALVVESILRRDLPDDRALGRDAQPEKHRAVQGTWVGEDVHRA